MQHIHISRHTQHAHPCTFIFIQHVQSTFKSFNFVQPTEFYRTVYFLVFCHCLFILCSFEWSSPSPWWRWARGSFLKHVSDEFTCLGGSDHQTGSFHIVCTSAKEIQAFLNQKRKWCLWAAFTFIMTSLCLEDHKQRLNALWVFCTFVVYKRHPMGIVVLHWNATVCTYIDIGQYVAAQKSRGGTTY